MTTPNPLHERAELERRHGAAGFVLDEIGQTMVKITKNEKKYHGAQHRVVHPFCTLAALEDKWKAHAHQDNTKDDDFFKKISKCSTSGGALHLPTPRRQLDFGCRPGHFDDFLSPVAAVLIISQLSVLSPSPSLFITAIIFALSLLLLFMAGLLMVS
jgi:hypothetical protein